MPRVNWLAPVRRTTDDIRPVLAPQGAVAGWMALDDGRSEAVVFRGGVPIRVARAVPGRSTFVTAAGEDGTLAGCVRGDNDRDCQAVRFRIGEAPIPLGSTGAWSIVHAAGPDGLLGGAAQTNAGATRPVLWERSGNVIELALPTGGTSGVVHALSADGTAVGAAEPGPGRKWAACIWPRGGKPMLLPGLPGGTTARVRAIGGKGRMVGWADTDEAEMAAVAWDDGRIRNLGTLGDEPASAWGIDALGRVVGTSANSRKRMRAFIHEDGILDDCNGRVVLSLGETLEIATDVDSAGRIVGLGRHEGRTWLFEIVPSPGEAPAGTRGEIAPTRLGLDRNGRPYALPPRRPRRVVAWFFCDCQQCHAVARAWSTAVRDGSVPAEAGVAVFSGNRVRGDAFVKDTSWPAKAQFLIDPDGRATKEWSAAPCPQGIVVDPRGRVVARVRERGAPHLVRAALAALSVG